MLNYCDPVDTVTDFLVSIQTYKTNSLCYFVSIIIIIFSYFKINVQIMTSIILQYDVILKVIVNMQWDIYLFPETKFASKSKIL